MKKIFTLFFFCSVCLLNVSAQIFYVDSAATGNNTGGSWLNAYTDLQTALTNAQAGYEIRVAKGTYKPGGDSAATFLISKDLVLKGGFETQGTDYNPALYKTILSGDLDGDDIDDDFIMNREDNVETVVTVNFNVTNATLIDGFVIRGGQADGVGTNTSPSKSGGGLYVGAGAPRIAHCVFEQNYAEAFGGGASFQNAAQQIVEIDSCVFSKNSALRGGGLQVQNSNCSVSSSTFQNNQALQYGGGMWFSTTGNDHTASVINNLFEWNQASIGGGIRVESLGNGNHFLVGDCDFIENSTLPLFPGWGQANAGLSMAFYPNKENNSAAVEDCYFEKNTSNGYGGAFNVANAGKNSQVEINSCIISQNEAQTWGALDILSNWSGATLTTTVSNSSFDQNTSGFGGGLTAGTYDGGQLDLSVTACVFTKNEASEHGALELFDWEDSPLHATIDACTFDGNMSTVRGGAIGLLPLTNDFEAVVSNCIVVNNDSPAGGAVDGYLSIGGTPVPVFAKTIIQNSLFAYNSGDAVFSLDAAGSLSLTNCTVAENTCGSIELGSQSSATLQNTILYNPDYPEYTALTGDVSLTSLGGNLVKDNSLGTGNPNDFEGQSPQFKGDGDLCDSFELTAGSPGYDQGMDWEDSPQSDICEHPRIMGDRIDIGARETFVDLTREVVISGIAISPNPATDFLQIDWPENLTSSLEIDLFNAQGLHMSKQAVLEGRPIEIGNFPTGIYTLKAKGGGQVYVAKFLKQ